MDVAHCETEPKGVHLVRRHSRSRGGPEVSSLHTRRLAMAAPPPERWVGLVGVLPQELANALGPFETETSFVVVRTQPPPKQLIVSIPGDQEVSLSVEDATSCGVRPRTYAASRRYASASVAQDCIDEMHASIAGPSVPQARRSQAVQSLRKVRRWSVEVARGFASRVRGENASSSDGSGSSSEDEEDDNDELLAGAKAAADTVVTAEECVVAGHCTEREAAATRRANRLEIARTFSRREGGRQNLVAQTSLLHRLVEGVARLGENSPGGLRLSGLIEGCFAQAAHPERLLLSAFRSFTGEGGAGYIEQQKQRAWLAILRRSIDLAAALLRVLVPKVLPRVRRAIQSGIVAFHKTRGVKLSETGPMSNYRFKLLRTSPNGDQSFERWGYASGTDAAGAGIYTVVRKAKWCEPTVALGPEVRVCSGA